MKKLNINDPEKKVRINKFLSEIGYCSRREADKLIDSKKISVNGKVISMGTKVFPSDKIEIDGIEIEKKNEKKIYIAFNKPKGIVCTTNTKVEKNNIIDFINYPKRIFPIGRLDKLSEGLILLTNDGDIINKILRSRNNHDKEYIVMLNKTIKDDFIKKMSNFHVEIKTPTKNDFGKNLNESLFDSASKIHKSIQPMSSLFDQALHIYGDIVALGIIEKLKINKNKLWKHHANLE